MGGECEVLGVQVRRGGLNDDVIKKYTRKKTYLKSIYPFEDITDQFNSSDWILFFWKNEPELVCRICTL